MCPKLKTRFNIQPMLTTVQKSHAKNLENSLYEKVGVSQKTGQEITNPFKLSKISNEASQFCKEVIKEIRMEARRIDQPELKQEQSQNRGRGM